MNRVIEDYLMKSYYDGFLWECRHCLNTIRTNELKPPSFLDLPHLTYCELYNEYKQLMEGY